MRFLRDARKARRIASRGAAVCAAACATLAVLAAIGPVASFAADGPQDEPELVPASVNAATDAFAIKPPTDARCEGTGADNWRWHGFIVGKGRDVSTLRFGPLGPGSDYNATDGTITAPLMAAGGEGVWQKLPALKPEGHINPDELAGLEFDPTVYKFKAGDYQIGFACTDGALATRGWWVTTVTISPTSPPFMTSASAAPKRTTTTTSAAAPKAAATVAPGSSSTTTTALGPAASKGSSDPSEEGATPPAPAAPPPPAPTSGISWAPLQAVRPVPGLLPVWIMTLLAIVFGRIAYLLARPARTRDPRRMGGAPSRRNVMKNGFRSRPAATAMLVAVMATLVVTFAAVRPAAAADGAQSPAPALLPSEVATATSAFSLDFAGSVFCDGTGTASWRVNTFIVNTGVNIGILDFQAGPLPGYVGADLDATDGTVSAPLFRGSDDAGVNFLPGVTPAGLIDGSDLAGYSFDPSIWTLADGNYQIGFVCTGPSLNVRQWWVMTVTIDADASSGTFMRVSSTPTPTTTVPGQTTTTVPGQMTTTTTVAGQTTTTIPEDESTTTTIPDEGTTTTTSTTVEDTTDTTVAVEGSDTGDTGSFDDGSGGGTGGGDLPTTGIGLGLVGLGAALLYVGRVLYLLSKRRSVTES